MKNNVFQVPFHQSFWHRSGENGGSWFVGITEPAAPDWNEGNLLSVNIWQRNDKAITACLADWKVETSYLVNGTNQYQGQRESN